MKPINTLLSVALAASAALSFAPVQAAEPAHAEAPAARPWTYKTPNLSKAQVDALLANPKGLLVVDLRRPDELVKYGSFPVYLNVQLKDLPKVLDFIPKDRTILTVSNHAHRAGAAGDLLASKGYTVGGATGSEDYEQAGGTVVRVAPVAPRTPVAVK